MPGTTTLAAEVTHISKHGFWLLLADEELRETVTQAIAALPPREDLGSPTEVPDSPHPSDIRERSRPDARAP